MKIKTTYEQLFIFARAAQAWLAKDKANERTKLGYAMHRMLARTEQFQNTYNNAVADLQVDACATDENDIILRDGRGQMEYTKDGFKELTRNRQALYESAIEVETYIATEVPKGLSNIELDEFAGFVIAPGFAYEEAPAGSSTAAEISDAASN